MGWFDDKKSPKLKSSKKANSQTPSGLWKKCPECAEIVYSIRLDENQQVCPYCDHHFRIDAIKRIELLVDKDSFKEVGKTLTSTDPLNFEDKKKYSLRLKAAKELLEMGDGTFVGEAAINGDPVAMAVMNFKFMGGSMGVATGEKIAHAMDIAYEKKIPAIVICSSGGARMQEGVLSLMQMAKTSASRQRLKNNGIPYIVLLTDPTTGGTAASFGMQGDIILAEPKALIGFAGPRVIEQSIRQSLPNGFQRSEYLKEHGFVDRIIHRRDLKKELSFFIKTFSQK